MFNYYRKKNIPVYLSGPPGVGKSDMIRQVCDEEVIGFRDVRLANKLPEDIGGIPVPDLERRIAIWLRAEFWPDVKRHGEKGVLFFDEMTDANKALQSCAYQIVLDRKINDYWLPPGWYPCAAGNRREDRASAQSLSTALANRFAHIDIRADVDCWYEWCMKTEYMGTLVPAFIKYRSNLLHSMEGANLMAFPTPRSWAQVAKLYPTDGEHPPLEYRHHLVAGLVGEGAAGEFEAFMKAINLPDLEEILANPLKCRIPKEPANKYALSCMLARALDKQTIKKLMQYMTREGYGTDFEICTIIDATKRDHSLCDTKEYAEFCNRNADTAM